MAIQLLEDDAARFKFFDHVRLDHSDQTKTETQDQPSTSSSETLEQSQNEPPSTVFESSGPVIVESTLMCLRANNLEALKMPFVHLHSVNDNLRFSQDISFMKVGQHDYLIGIDQRDVRHMTPDDVYSIINEKTLNNSLTFRFMKWEKLDEKKLKQKRVRKSCE